MTDQLTLTGIVGTQPRQFTTSAGLAITSFRLATAHRVYDRETRSWKDLGSNWYTVACFRTLADHVLASIHKGERVIVTGKLRLKNWSSDGREGVNVDLEADSIGHDLLWGTSIFTRSESRASEVASLAGQAVPAEGQAETGTDGFVPSQDEPDWPTALPGSAA